MVQLQQVLVNLTGNAHDGGAVFPLTLSD